MERAKKESDRNGNILYLIGNFRIPKTMLTNLDGSRIGADSKYPNKGIIRSKGGQVKCQFASQWNMYKCTDINYKMIIIESLDPDTEDRRLSPIGLASRGYIDLINGPQDHGWCLGYTCQERLSTFNTLVSTEEHYEIHLTSFNPQKTRYQLLNAQAKDAITVEIYHAKAQRYDVYRKGKLLAFQLYAKAIVSQR